MQSFEVNKSDIQKLNKALEGTDSELLSLLKEYHSSEIAILFESLNQEEQKRIINLLPSEIASEVISEMDLEYHPEEILINLPPEKRQEIVEELDYDDATDIISLLDEEDQHEILQDIDKEDAHNIRTLLHYEEDTAGGLMNSQLIKVQATMTKKQAIDEIIAQSEEMEEFYTVYVVDEHDRLQGIISLKNLLKSKASSSVSDILNEEFIYVKTNIDQETVANLLSQYNLTSIPVVDDEMKLLGRVTFDDIIDVLNEETTEDILKISGVSEDEELSGNWKDAVKSRLPWLCLNLFTAFLASSVIRYFDSTIDLLLILPAYMTIIAGMGGNAATQALAVTVRRITLNDLTDQQAYRTVLKEFTVGLTNGAIIGIILFLVALLYDSNPMLGLVIFIAMAGNLIIAGVAGSAIPLILKKVNIDPAIASSIIITTFTDVFGFLLLLGLASKLLL